ncbi:DUF2057 family protein [Psychromonas sp. Urea-02u-13]|uniref:DUF2057 family protein n=1 Tax=Psychromonas sp. Urea-02u-13 TaxID=2058326 RepID=UPI000C33333A|nr:DUF2057 family protein [Psychromonas sp. Urea-02u-13]PKG40995.1 hypothetical protein CXF74_00430 [Psychromonas sp. Urea-02u-13]
MRTISAVLLTLAMIPSSYALELEGVNGVEILAINGKEVKNSFFSQKSNKLKAGEHQIVVRYSTQFNNDDIIESRPAIFSIDLQQDTKISVQQMNTQRQAEKQIKAGLTWQISSEDNQYKIDDSTTLEGKGFMPYSDIEALIVAYNQENNIALATSGTVAVAVAAATATTVASTQKGTLQSLYQQASKEEKKAFRLWLVEQDMK